MTYIQPRTQTLAKVLLRRGAVAKGVGVHSLPRVGVHDAWSHHCSKDKEPSTSLSLIHKVQGQRASLPQPWAASTWGQTEDVGYMAPAWPQWKSAWWESLKTA